MSKKSKPLLALITGLSGAGRSVAIRALEDNGFYCIENLPLAMFDAAIDFIKSSDHDSFALGLNVAEKKFAEQFPRLKEKLAKEFEVDVVFLTADEQTIASRYSTTRRKHPLLDTGGEIVGATLREKKLLEPVEQCADAIFDTTPWSPHYLARVIENRYSKHRPSRNLFVTITSFGFKYGLYRPADSIYDVRFLDNPYFVSDLKDKSGLNEAVKEFIFGDARSEEFLKKLLDLHKFLLPEYYKEGKHYFRIGIGCTGGKHRSVCIAEELGKRLSDAKIDKVLVSVFHRDLNEFILPAQQ